MDFKTMLLYIDDYFGITEWIDNGQTEQPLLGEMRMASITALIAIAGTLFGVALLIAVRFAVS